MKTTLVALILVGGSVASARGPLTNILTARVQTQHTKVENVSDSVHADLGKKQSDHQALESLAKKLPGNILFYTGVKVF